MGILKMGVKNMKKILVVFSLCFAILCSGCKVNVYDYDKNDNSDVPTTLINTTGSQTIETDLTKLYNNTVKSVVTVLNYASYYDRGQIVTSLYGSGSGFIYAYDDNYIYLYTNAHVVSVGTGYNQSYYEIVFYDGVRSYGNLVAKDGSEDVAIMKVGRESQSFAVASIGNSDTVNPGEDIFALGSPLGLDYSNTITKGIVSNVEVGIDTDDDGDGNATTMYLIQVDASLNPGNSGGPLFNMKGEVVGVNTLKIMTNDGGEDVETFNFAIPINHFVMVTNSLAENGSYKRPLMGVTVIDVKDMPLKDKDSYGIKIYKGIYIESVSSSGASNGVLSKGEIIIKINDIVIDDMADFSCQLYKYESGDSIRVTTVDVNGNNMKNHNIVLK